MGYREVSKVTPKVFTQSDNRDTKKLKECERALHRATTEGKPSRRTLVLSWIFTSDIYQSIIHITITVLGWVRINAKEHRSLMV